MIEFDEKILKKNVVVKVTDEKQLMTLLKWGDSKGLKWSTGKILLDNSMINTLKRPILSSKVAYLDLSKYSYWSEKVFSYEMAIDYDNALLKEKPGFDLDKAMSMYKDIVNVCFLPGKKITIVALKTYEIGVAMLQNGDIYDEEKGFLYAYVKALRSKFIWGSKYLEK